MRWLRPIAILVFISFGVSLHAGTQTDPKRAWLGFGYRIHNFESKSEIRQWLYVLRVEPSGPAFMAGLRVQDAVIAINRKAVRFPSAAAAITFFRGARVGEEFELKVLREGKVHVLRVRAAELPSMYSEAWRSNDDLAKRVDSSTKKPREP